MSAGADSHSQHQQERTPCEGGRMQIPRPAPVRARDRKFQSSPSTYKSLSQHKQFSSPLDSAQFTSRLSIILYQVVPISQYML